MHQKNDPGELSLKQQFTSAAIGLGAGLGAAFGVYEAIEPQHIVTSLMVLSSFFAACGGAAGYADAHFTQKNRKDFRDWLNNRP